jgi:winged helix DNA-binding protein
MQPPAPALKLDWDQVAGWRQRRHRLDERAPRAEMLAVTSRIAGLHAQVMSSAEQTLWARVDGLEPSAVADALWRDRTLVKTWAMRGTLPAPRRRAAVVAGGPEHQARLRARCLAARLRHHP